MMTRMELNNLLQIPRHFSSPGNEACLVVLWGAVVYLEIFSFFEVVVMAIRTY